MINPFVSAPKISALENLLHREEQIMLLENYIDSRTNAWLSGPEGSGKSTLLECFFNVDYRKRMAGEKTLIILRQFPTGKTGEFTYGYFADAIRSSVEVLEMWGYSADAERLLKSMDQKQYDSNMSRFRDYLDKVHNQGYHVVFVLDNFENFTSAPEINAECHDLLCGFLNDYMLQMIVATNYDFSKTSLPEGTHNSTLLSRLAPHQVAMEPLAPKDCEKLLAGILERRRLDFRFAPEELEYIYELSGGIPLLVNMAAKQCFLAVDEETEDWKDFTLQNTLLEAQPLMKLWCKVMSGEQMELLRSLPETGKSLTDKENSAADGLLTRGVLQKDFFFDRRGRKRLKDGLIYSCALLKEFAQHRDWMQDAARSNPFARETAPTHLPYEAQEGDCNLFISYKANWNDEPTKDAEIAREIFGRMCTVDGVKPFLDKAELQKNGSSEFGATISRALDSAKIFVYVCTNPVFLQFEQSPYVYNEWSTYVNELNSGRKPKGSVYGVTTAAPEEIPIDLRKFEMMPCTSAGLDSLVEFVRSKIKDILAVC